MNQPNEADSERILIVEGYSDLAFCAEFLEHLGRLNGVFIKIFGGRSNILKRKVLEAELAPDVLAQKKAIGILIDADSDARKVSERLGRLIQEVTGRVISEGAWNEGRPRLGFFVAPDGSNPGELETLVWNVWSANDEHSGGKESVLTHLSTMESAGWPAKSPDKARIGAFLAAAHDEDPRLGPGAQKRLFNFDDSGFDRLRKFLLEFTEPAAS